jgi:hypothetical protein
MVRARYLSREGRHLGWDRLEEAAKSIASLAPRLLMLSQNERSRLRTVQSSTQRSIKRNFFAHRRSIPVGRGR